MLSPPNGVSGGAATLPRQSCGGGDKSVPLVQRTDTDQRPLPCGSLGLRRTRLPESCRRRHLLGGVDIVGDQRRAHIDAERKEGRRYEGADEGDKTRCYPKGPGGRLFGLGP